VFLSPVLSFTVDAQPDFNLVTTRLRRADVRCIVCEGVRSLVGLILVGVFCLCQFCFRRFMLLLRF
jgi:hypothetical protein